MTAIKHSHVSSQKIWYFLPPTYSEEGPCKADKDTIRSRAVLLYKRKHRITLLHITKSAAQHWREQGITCIIQTTPKDIERLREPVLVSHNIILKVAVEGKNFGALNLAVRAT